MGSLSLGEILVILVVILVVFGPRRLPELSRRAGELISKAREATTYVSSAIDSEYGEAMTPIKELKQEFDGLKGDVNRALTSIGDFDEPAAPVTPKSESADTPDPPHTDQ